MPIPDFILRLREKIGHDPLWLAGVTAVVVRDAEVLLVKRSDNGRWTPVTGIMDPGELPTTAALREVLEETGVTCELGSLVTFGVTPPVVHVNGDQAQYLEIVFRCPYVSGFAHPADDESSDVAWFPLDALPPMTERFRAMVLQAARHRGEPILAV
ncbi:MULTISPECIES: NUDIX domain-containing protein [Arthrobacter]|uniref:NUDIX domain-containing protein n=2 Tax=Arthrobacter TaxID=1663 RepID=A0ABU9KIF3_9MICC|nr:NUDIX domain-containing protein [Arthrobacter sp. YJM1]MDP5225977.1 NUDIX domain-containing protein [Arthrobacter sp. YJM1]